MKRLLIPILIASALITGCSSNSTFGSKLEAKQACERWVKGVPKHSVLDDTHSYHTWTGAGMEWVEITVSPDSELLDSRKCTYESETNQFLGFVRGNPRKVYDNVKQIKKIQWRVLRRFQY